MIDKARMSKTKKGEKGKRRRRKQIKRNEQVKVRGKNETTKDKEHQKKPK
jgi:hypothetical protein